MGCNNDPWGRTSQTTMCQTESLPGCPKTNETVEKPTVCLNLIESEKYLSLNVFNKTVYGILKGKEYTTPGEVCSLDLQPMADTML